MVSEADVVRAALELEAEYLDDLGRADEAEAIRRRVPIESPTPASAASSAIVVSTRPSTPGGRVEAAREMTSALEKLQAAMVSNLLRQRHFSAPPAVLPYAPPLADMIATLPGFVVGYSTPGEVESIRSPFIPWREDLAHAVEDVDRAERLQVLMEFAALVRDQDDEIHSARFLRVVREAGEALGLSETDLAYVLASAADRRH